VISKLAEHYNTVILPTRVRKPKDKAIVENHVLHIQRFILGRLRDSKFFSLYEINAAIFELLDEFNSKPMQEYKKSRKERFVELDKPFAKELPAESFPYTVIKTGIKVNKDYHIEYEKNYYSVPYQLCGKRVEIRQINNVLEIYYDIERICSHKISFKKYGYTTEIMHCPSNHKFVKGWSPGYFLNRGMEIGSNTTEVIKRILKKNNHPEVGYRSSMGLLNLIKKYPKERIENAATRALYFNTASRKSIISILEKELDKEPLQEKEDNKPIQQLTLHENIRGGEFYNLTKEKKECF